MHDRGARGGRQQAGEESGQHWQLRQAATATATATAGALCWQAGSPPSQCPSQCPGSWLPQHPAHPPQPPPTQPPHTAAGRIAVQQHGQARQGISSSELMGGGSSSQQGPLQGSVRAGEVVQHAQHTATVQSAGKRRVGDVPTGCHGGEGLLQGSRGQGGEQAWQDGGWALGHALPQGPHQAARVAGAQGDAEQQQLSQQGAGAGGAGIPCCSSQGIHCCLQGGLCGARGGGVGRGGCCLQGGQGRGRGRGRGWLLLLLLLLVGWRCLLQCLRCLHPCAAAGVYDGSVLLMGPLHLLKLLQARKGRGAAANG